MDLSTWIDCYPEEAMKIVTHFNESSEEFGKLMPVDGSQEAIEDFVANDFSLSIITSCSDDGICRTRRHENLKDVFGDIFDEIHCLPLGVKKSNYLSRYDSSFWVENNYSNAEMG